jgi:SAM-dependent methyltransferase
MDPASMVHALEEIWRVLVPGGTLIDVRPLADRWQVEVISTRELKETGRVNDMEEQVQADIASNEAMREAETRGWFSREQEHFFPFFYSWDAPSEMEAFLAEEWTDFVELGENTKETTRSAWALGDADCRVRIRVKILISRWKKL